MSVLILYVWIMIPQSPKGHPHIASFNIINNNAASIWQKLKKSIIKFTASFVLFDESMNQLIVAAPEQQL